MGLFQHSVLNKYLNEADRTKIKTAFQKLTDYFHNPVIQLQIKEASILKEENVTKQIYVDYSSFKHDLYNDLMVNFTKIVFAFLFSVFLVAVY